MIDFTTVVAVDNHTLRFLQHTAPTWREHRPEMFERPVVALADWRIFDVARAVLPPLLGYNVNVCRWPDGGMAFPGEMGCQYETQREFMLTAFVCQAPYVVDTPYWMKVDCDAIASASPQWLDPLWFAQQPVYVASGWSYTKAKGGGGNIADWCQRLEIFGDTHWPDKPRLGMLDHISGDKCKMKRMASWVSYYSTEWTRDMAEFLDEDKLPVPSQDTFHWYCAARGKYTVHHAKMKRRGWANSPRLEKVRQLATEAMGDGELHKGS